jgi:hypothetical protein
MSEIKHDSEWCRRGHGLPPKESMSEMTKEEKWIKEFYAWRQIQGPLVTPMDAYLAACRKGEETEKELRDKLIHEQAKNFAYEAEKATPGYLLKRAEQAEAEVKELQDYYDTILSSTCSDEKHCTCVPGLRKEIYNLQASKERLLEAIGKATNSLVRISNLSYSDFRPFVERYENDGTGLFREHSTPRDWETANNISRFIQSISDEHLKDLYATADKEREGKEKP